MQCKQVIVARKDLRLSPGKLAAQVAHASVECVLQILNSNRNEWKKWLEEWIKEGQKKVVLKVSSLDELLVYYNNAKSLGLPASLIKDAGLTQVPEGTITAVGIGPAPEELVDKITGMLDLY
ncbi:peptidyl-tRNA hydrolase [Fervidicoccus fontis]|jgi:PTH2 family peptidyl-tRNA hydrolase|uniref:Peptidyl-tRNA hydrolase n=2 Tax=Fervidicoccus fontis TaxID=683846 RepID=I0A042_FERFK|nr:peptidyl-tRNA hydrolase Pth2 [Fervidicoccus fontis]AFH42349.1 peptidyl-tRNA hydrolase [Fervidicoccus fontis Kam940]MBE9391722.1 peptidyl-tRNA hydrolase [Fervidicoccus fontis]PMB76358.1 MAG: aminoacyl-tRNA hydrolase [Fervidicoccus fontis]